MRVSWMMERSPGGRLRAKSEKRQKEESTGSRRKTERSRNLHKLCAILPTAFRLASRCFLPTVLLLLATVFSPLPHSHRRVAEQYPSAAHVEIRRCQLGFARGFAQAQRLAAKQETIEL